MTTSADSECINEGKNYWIKNKLVGLKHKLRFFLALINVHFEFGGSWIAQGGKAEGSIYPILYITASMDFFFLFF